MTITAAGASRRPRGAGPCRRVLLLAAAAWAAAGCASSPPTRWYALRNDPPAVPSADAGDGAVWEVGGVALPGALDRETLVVAAGAATLEPLSGHRWAEPLRDAVPRLLVHDLALLRGPGLVWAAPAPHGVAVARALKVEVLTLQAGVDRRVLKLQSRWWLVDTRPDAAPPRAGRADLEIPLADAGVDALAAAHRLALWRLAERIAATR